MLRLAAGSSVVIGTASPVQRSTYMSWRADMYRQRAADAKNRAAQAKDLFIKSAFEHVVGRWVALAEQVEADRQGEVSDTRRRKQPLGPLTENDGDLWEYILIITGSGMRRPGSVAVRPVALPLRRDCAGANRGRLAVVEL